jgi:hypothetical protein
VSGAGFGLATGFGASGHFATVNHLPEYLTMGAHGPQPRGHAPFAVPAHSTVLLQAALAAPMSQETKHPQSSPAKTVPASAMEPTRTTNVTNDFFILNPP